MGKDVILYRQPPSDQLHPIIYQAAVGLVLCFALSAWIFFDRQNDVAWLLAVASGLLFVAVLLPALLWRVWRREQQAGGDSAPFRRWASGDFRAGESKLKASHAAIDVLLPLASVACGITALGIVFALIASAQ
jgi:hypothetical protein